VKAQKGDKRMNEMDKKKYGCCDSTQNHIEGILCDVKNCQYHEGDCYCTADKIAVGPSFATSSTHTVCATFKPKKD
jgi:hypothetical protein